MKLPVFITLIFLVVICPIRINAQDCAPPAIVANSKAYNIFTPEQETVLGELTYQRMLGELRLVRDPELNAYLDRIGEKLIKHLPAIGLKFQFHIIDLPEANAFNIPGGYVFVSRKLISFARNEDELAGVLAHELGHATVRHSAVDFSFLLKKILNVTQLGDRKDVVEKYNLFLERHRTKRIRRDVDHENDQQQEADRIGLFAMVAAGYDPTAFTEFFARLVESKVTGGGNWFSDIFGGAKPADRRIREMVKATERLPVACRDQRPGTDATQNFVTWQANVVSHREASRKEELPALLWKKELSPKLRTDLSHFAFSPDGTHFLAQDDFSITVIRRKPLEVVFQIPASEARNAAFTPDGQFVVFGTENLRFEKWSIADKKPAAVRELVLRRDCWEHEFSPDGNYLACVDYELNLNVLETQTGKKVWEKKKFYELNFFEYLTWITRDEDSETNLFHIQFSPDSRFAIVSRSQHARFSLRLDFTLVAGTENTVLALDLSNLKQVGVGGDIKNVARRPFIFLDAQRILGRSSIKWDDGGIFSFPDGKRLARFRLGGDQMKRTGNPDYVVIKPVSNNRIGIFDLNRQKLIGGLNKEDIAFWKDTAVYESVNGKILLSEVQYNEEHKSLDRTESGTVDIPVGPVGRIYTAQVSDNFRWLAVSAKTRGAIWELTSGEQKIFVRGFRGALVVNDGGAIADFPKQEPAGHTLVLLNTATKEVSPLREIPEKGARQYNAFVLVRESLRAPRKDQDEKKTALGGALDDLEGDPSLNHEVRFELRSVIDDKVVWIREFPKAAPGYFFDAPSGRLIFYWTLGSEAGKAQLKQDANLAARAKQMGNKDDDYLFEVVDAFAGKTVGTLLLETGQGSFDIESAFSDGEWLVIRDDDNRVLVYSIKEGNVRHRFFGAEAALNVTRQQIAVENYPGELTIYDLATGDVQSRLVFGRDAALTRYSLDGKRLFVLTTEQVAYAFDVDKLATSSRPN